MLFIDILTQSITWVQEDVTRGIRRPNQHMTVQCLHLYKDSRLRCKKKITIIKQFTLRLLWFIMLEEEGGEGLEKEVYFNMLAIVPCCLNCIILEVWCITFLRGDTGVQN